MGNEIHDIINERYATLMDALWDGFSETEISNLLGSYKRMVKNLEEHQQQKE
jgi:hypothetical protein